MPELLGLYLGNQEFGLAEKSIQEATVKAGKLGTAHGRSQKPEPRSLDVLCEGRH